MKFLLLINDKVRGVFLAPGQIHTCFTPRA